MKIMLFRTYLLGVIGILYSDLSLSNACKYRRIYVDILDNESSNIIKNNKLCLVGFLFHHILFLHYVF